MRKIYWFDIALITMILTFATTITLQVIHRVEHKRDEPFRGTVDRVDVEERWSYDQQKHFRVFYDNKYHPGVSILIDNEYPILTFRDGDYRGLTTFMGD